MTNICVFCKYYVGTHNGIFKCSLFTQFRRPVGTIVFCCDGFTQFSYRNASLLYKVVPLDSIEYLHIGCVNRSDSFSEPNKNQVSFKILKLC